MRCLRVLCIALAFSFARTEEQVAQNEFGRKVKTHYLRATLTMDPTTVQPPSPNEAAGAVGGAIKGVIGGIGAVGGGVVGGIGAIGGGAVSGIGGGLGDVGAPPDGNPITDAEDRMGRNCIPYSDKAQSYGTHLSNTLSSFCIHMFPCPFST